MISILGITNSSQELDFFAKKLMVDYSLLHTENKEFLKNISLFAKWAPTQNNKKGNKEGNKEEGNIEEGKKEEEVETNSFDIYKAIRNRIFNGNRDEKYRKMISALRKHLNIVENLMSHNKWDDITFDSVPAKAMFKYGKNYITCKKKKSNEEESYHEEENNNTYNERKIGAFLYHCKDRYVRYLDNVNNGKSKINITGLEPHKIISNYVNCNTKFVDEMFEAQWKSIIANLYEKCINKDESNESIIDLRNSYAVVDVSGSMSGTPMDVAITLGLIINELSNNDIITFSNNPKWHTIPSGENITLYDKVKSLKSANWGQNTNFDLTMKLILNDLIAKSVFDANFNKNITLFIFSDMQFDSAMGRGNKIAYNYYKNLFNESGFEMPNIVFWNLRNPNNLDMTCPVTINDNNVVLISGFSSDLLKNFMSCTKFDPMSFVLSAISKYEVYIDPTESINF